MKKYLLAVLLAAMAIPAQAFEIKNMSDQPQSFVLEQGGAKQEIVLAPGQRYWRNGVGIVLHREGRAPIRAHQVGEYSIWPDGDIHIQRYDKVQLGNK